MKEASLVAMNQEMTLHILNGQNMYDYYKKIHFLKEDIMVPFNEAMCFGETSNELFTKEFIEKRAKVHHVTPEQYIEITLIPIQPLLSKNFNHIELWFDEDMFCQINILTILAWLDQQGHKNPIDLHIVDDKFEPIENFILLANGYYELFKQVMIHKTYPDSIHPAPLKKGIELYLNYLKKDSNLMFYIQEHKNMSVNELVSALIANFTEYGLGDLQYLELINTNRK